MRVTNRFMINSLLHDLERALGEISNFQKQLATSKRINKPSDDPIGAFRVLDLNDEIADNVRYMKNIEDGRHWLITTEKALTDASDIISGINVLTIQALNDPLNEENREQIAVRVADYIDQLVEIANKKEIDKYVFAGTQTQMPPYSITDEITDESFTAVADTTVLLDYTELLEGSVVVTDPGGGGSYVEGVDYTIDYKYGTITVLSTGSMTDGNSYEIDYHTTRPSKVVVNPNGNAGELIRHIDDASELTINVRGDDVFDAGTDIFDILRQLKNSMIRNDTDLMSEGLGNLDTSMTQIHNSITLVGSRLDRLTMAASRREEEDVLLRSLLSSVYDTDVAETIVRLQTEQVTYETALRTTAELLQTSLIDFLQ